MRLTDGGGAGSHMARSKTKPVVSAGSNCWKIARANRAAVIVDACDYFRIARAAMLRARRRILLIGWDFDPRIHLQRPEDGGVEDETLGSLLLDIARQRPDIAIDILKWDVGALKMFFRGRAIFTLARWAMTRPITFEFDHAHPAGCSHHQKIVIIDDSFAVCGGIDMTRDRWDTNAHKDDDPRRRRPGGQLYGPWHDVTMVVDGEAARALGELGRKRWERATGRAIEPVEPVDDIWPDELEPDFTNVDVAIARTRAEHDGAPEVKEIEALYLDMIARAERFIYAENQYLTSGKIGAAIAARMREKNPPEFVLVMPLSAEGWLEQKAMDGARVRLGQAIGHVDTHNRFRIYTPRTRKGGDIYVHAKVMIVDDRVLRIGSSNLNNRSLGLDSECDLAIDTALEANAKAGERIAALRTRLMAEHLDVAEAEVDAKFRETGSLVATIEALRHSGKTLDLLAFEKPDAVEDFIAENELLDPESPDEMFESIAHRGLFRRWRGVHWHRRG